MQSVEKIFYSVGLVLDAGREPLDVYNSFSEASDQIGY
ncbi:hypothetical protein TcasGA2_TC033089 [Tribolium castaneum]|uniref:Uncharacterized protein n=1 Tax=Tribolium castaneum TaxID=7070 RepID=A0A139WIJ5_TRICA|nr:hypothetical protein TcasGA2_TC033089 [Tribolium castaneum]